MACRPAPGRATAGQVCHLVLQRRHRGREYNATVGRPKNTRASPHPARWSIVKAPRLFVMRAGRRRSHGNGDVQGTLPQKYEEYHPSTLRELAAAVTDCPAPFVRFCRGTSATRDGQNGHIIGPAQSPDNGGFPFRVFVRDTRPLNLPLLAAGVPGNPRPCCPTRAQGRLQGRPRTAPVCRQHRAFPPGNLLPGKPPRALFSKPAMICRLRHFDGSPAASRRVLSPLQRYLRAASHAGHAAAAALISRWTVFEQSSGRGAARQQQAAAVPRSASPYRREDG